LDNDHRLLVDGVETVDVDAELHFRRMFYIKKTNKNIDQAMSIEAARGAPVACRQGLLEEGSKRSDGMLIRGTKERRRQTDRDRQT